ncbi:MAG: DUF1127 domain-containing protein [Pseudomonadota bacterium]
MAYISHPHRTHSAARGPRPSFWTLLALWRSRRALARLDARALKDIGLSAQDAAHEAAKPIWDVPHYWQR